MSKKVKITLAKSAGFCFGVKRAINLALKTAKKYTDAEMLGDIVHNEDVVKNVTKAGIKEIKRLTKSKNKVLLICAHGATLKAYENAKKLGYKIIDATCPMVTEIHKITMSMEKQGRKIIIIGDKNHVEVKGIIGHLKSKPVIVNSRSSMPLKKIESAAVVVQSTQNSEEVLKTIRALKKRIKNMRFFNTICNPTRAKQTEVKKMPLKNDMMIVIGSKKSANTKRLFEISKSLNKKTYWIHSKHDFKKTWLKKVKSIGITAGASTPDTTTKEVIQHIKCLTNTYRS